MGHPDPNFFSMTCAIVGTYPYHAWRAFSLQLGLSNQLATRFLAIGQYPSPPGSVRPRLVGFVNGRYSLYETTSRDEIIIIVMGSSSYS